MKKLSRRQVVLGLGAVGAGAALAPLALREKQVAAISPPALPSCTVTPQQTEGPFYFDTKMIRKDITEGRPGTILDLKLKVVDEACEPVRDAVVDIWSCDAGGVYSGYETVYTKDGEFKEQRGLPKDKEKHRGDNRPRYHEEPNNEKTYLRGAQVTDTNGEVAFKTIYPGWYPGRATHIHIKVYLDNNDVFTSQIYFPEDVNDAVYAAEAYRGKSGNRTLNTDDGIFKRSGKSPFAEMTAVEGGYVGTLTFGIERA